MTEYVCFVRPPGFVGLSFLRVEGGRIAPGSDARRALRKPSELFCSRRGYRPAGCLGISLFLGSLHFLFVEKVVPSHSTLRPSV